MTKIVSRLAPWWRSRAMGLAVIALGAFAVLSPFWSGEWTLALLGLVVSVSAAMSLLRSILVRDGPSAESRYIQSVVMLLVGFVLFYSPALILRGVVGLLGALLVVDGVMKIVSVVRRDAAGRLWGLLNGLLHVVVGVLVIRYRYSLGPASLGLLVGIWLVSRGWEMFFLGRDDATGELAVFAPGARLGLTGNPEFHGLANTALAKEAEFHLVDLRWCMGLGLVFFIVHIGRMDLRWDVLGAVSTLVAVVGDLLFAVVLAITIVLPLRLLWRGLTRGLERSAWRRRFEHGGTSAALGDTIAAHWLDGRLRFDARLYSMRGSVATAITRVIQFGLPLTAVLVAINPIWGFSWFFNTENWVSGFWQKLVELRVDPWRSAMIDAVAIQHGATSAAIPELFEVRPDGVAGAADFSFLVLGDTGEGDSSQHSLKDRFLLEGIREDIKFLVVSSDVIYPAGAMKDYEFNFYLPFKGFEKPIYAIPGNHDWFGALDAFNANFLEPDAARASIRARLAADHLLTHSAEERVDGLVEEAGRLRREYRIDTGHQRAPFFELSGASFALIAVDTGILKRIDDRQRGWLEAALERAKGKFTMVILGHPLYAAGYDEGRLAPDFAAIHDLLAKHEVPLVLAGDTHDFEYYRETYDTAGGPKTMHHFVDGGGGAYLSIGTSLDWPADPPVADWAFYPSTDAVRAKLDRETPTWKKPFWWWLTTASGWPGSIEGLSGAFDFNRAPFFQSFLEVRVEGSARRVRLILHGVHGPLRWRDLQIGGAVVPPGQGPDDPAEFVVPM
jgi:uncharacterized membrane protein HdeD (DUF308 family)/3',5'-cyclic AMP phosphodiesterase CpdA